VPVATAKTELSVTRISGGAQHTAEAHFAGDVRHPTITVSPSGAVTIAITGGNGAVTLSTATYMRNGLHALTGRSRSALHGRTRLHRHTPKVKPRHHKSRKHH
jgi:hypothetical protein